MAVTTWGIKSQQTQAATPSYPITFENVTKSYGGNVVVNDLSFGVEPGRVTGFLGPNGAGKSTTMKILLGLASATSGQARIGGRSYGQLSDPTGTVGASVESDAFHPGRTGRNHLRILADATGISLERVDEVLELVGLTDAAHRRAGTYSLGMKQRLGLGTALLCDPPVLILDEPGNGLDPQGVRFLRKLLRARAALGHTVFVSSHLLGEVEQLADDVVVVNKGKLVTSGSLAELRHSAAMVRTAAPDPMRSTLKAAGADVETGKEGELVVRGMSLEQIGESAHQVGIALHELSRHNDSLEERFFAWTDGATAGSHINSKEEK